MIYGNTVEISTPSSGVPRVRGPIILRLTPCLLREYICTLSLSLSPFSSPNSILSTNMPPSLLPLSSFPRLSLLQKCVYPTSPPLPLSPPSFLLSSPPPPLFLPPFFSPHPSPSLPLPFSYLTPPPLFLSFHLC